MRHLKKGKKFNRKKGARQAFLKNLASNLIRRGKIETTETRAKAIRPRVERLVSLAKKETLASRRILLSRLGNSKVVDKLVSEVGPRYRDRAGGYLRITKLGRFRKRDGVNTARIEFV